jgi:hypothetical protein
VGLRLLERGSSPPFSPKRLSESENIASTLKAAVLQQWEDTEGFSSDVFQTLCDIVAAALNRRPTLRSTPQGALEKLEEQGNGCAA